MFGTSGVRGPVGDVVTAEVALSIGRAVGSMGTERAVVGRDARTSGAFLADACAAGLMECGVDVVRLGQVATPTVARSVAWQDADAGVVVTASHNPPADNGLKLWTPSGRAFDADQRAAVTRRVREDAYDVADWDAVGTTRSWDEATATHRRRLCAAARDDTDGPDSLAGVSVVVDVGNGVGRVTADALTDLGADVETLNAQPDGRFPGRPSEPTPETCSGLCSYVERTDADLGVAHDGDADRMMAVDDTGTFVPGDVLLALFGRARAGRGDTVVAPVNTSLAVDDALDAVGASLDRTPVGDVFVAERAAELGAVFGGEPSGAWIWPAETLCPDGPLAAVKLAQLVADGDSLADRVAAIEQYPLRRTAVETDEKAAVMERVADQITDRYDDVSTVDGVRVALDDGWFLVRASGTQPLVRLTAEARTADRAEDLLDRARAVVEAR